MILDAAKPLVILLTCFYGCGAKSFESIRPEPINAPLKGFHQDVNAALDFGARILNAAKHEAFASQSAMHIPSRMLMVVNREFRSYNKR